METITEKEWEKWCEENEPTNTVVRVYADHTVACGTVDEVEICFIIEG